MSLSNLGLLAALLCLPLSLGYPTLFYRFANGNCFAQPVLGQSYVNHGGPVSTLRSVGVGLPNADRHSLHVHRGSSYGRCQRQLACVEAVVCPRTCSTITFAVTLNGAAATTLCPGQTYSVTVSLLSAAHTAHCRKALSKALSCTSQRGAVGKGLSSACWCFVGVLSLLGPLHVCY